MKRAGHLILAIGESCRVALFAIVILPTIALGNAAQETAASAYKPSPGCDAPLAQAAPHLAKLDESEERPPGDTPLLSTQRYSDPGKEITDPRQAEELSAYFEKHYPPDAHILLFQKGGENYAFQVTPKEGPAQIILMPRDHNRMARVRYLKAMELMKQIRERFGEEGAAAFPTITKIDLGRGDDERPKMIMPDTGHENLFSNVNELGAKAGFDTLANFFDSTLRPLTMMHALGYSHNDIKLENYICIPVDDKITEIKLIDFGLISKMDEEPYIKDLPEGFIPLTNTYARPLTTFRSRSGKPVSNIADPSRDTYAYMVLMQMALLGEKLDATTGKAAPHVVISEVSIGPFNVPSLVLMKSPHSIDKNIPETLSTISFTHYPSPAAIQHGLNEAKKYKDTPDEFYSAYYGPAVLSRMTAKLAARTAFGDDAIRARLQTPRGLGLPPRARKKIILELQKLDVEHERQEKEKAEKEKEAA